MKHRLHKLSVYLRGWMGYFGISEPYREIPQIDGWIRRRVRMCYWKQWRWCRTKIRELLRLGTPQGTAIRAGLNRGGPWTMARRLAAQSGMTSPWLGSRFVVCQRTVGENPLPGYGSVTL
jgi:RNA-directed DNA polymerase